MHSPDAATFTVHYLAQAPPDVRRLAERLSRAQGCKVRVAAERSGFQIYLPCPSCLHTHGESEMYDPKYVVNAQKYLGAGAFRDETDYGTGFNPARGARFMEQESERNWRSGVCMRTRDSASNRHIHSMDELLNGPTITERHPDIHTRAAISFSGGSDDRERFWDKDPVTGVMRPPAAGVVIPLTMLPSNHPAIEYVVGRGFDPKRLYDHLRAGFCVQEYPSSEEKQIFYRRMVAGWRDTPQHRIIFHALHQGTPMTWQGRYIEKLSPSGLEKFALHPYATPFRWDLVAVRANLKAAWIPVSPFDEVDADGKPRWEPSKYKTAKHSTRELMGWDAALKRAEADPELLKWCVMVEGPMDAARPGPGGIALIGKSITPDNAAKVARHFHMAFTAFDNDRAGREATEKVTRSLLAAHRSSLLQHVAPLDIPDGKDLGEMAQPVFDGIMMRALKRARRGL